MLKGFIILYPTYILTEQLFSATKTSESECITTCCLSLSVAYSCNRSSQSSHLASHESRGPLKIDANKAACRRCSY